MFKIYRPGLDSAWEGSLSGQICCFETILTLLIMTTAWGLSVGPPCCEILAEQSRRLVGNIGDH